LATSVTGSLPGNMAIAFQPNGRLLAVGPGGSSALYNINPTTAAPMVVTNLAGAGFSSIGDDWDLKSDINGNTYLLNVNNIYSVNTTNGQLTLVWQTSSYNIYGIGDEAGRLFGFTTSGQIISINLADGTGTLVTNESCSSPIVAVCNGG